MTVQIVNLPPNEEESTSSTTSPARPALVSLTHDFRFTGTRKKQLFCLAAILMIPIAFIICNLVLFIASVKAETFNQPWQFLEYEVIMLCYMLLYVLAFCLAFARKGFPSLESLTREDWVKWMKENVLIDKGSDPQLRANKTCSRRQRFALQLANPDTLWPCYHSRRIVAYYAAIIIITDSVNAQMSVHKPNDSTMFDIGMGAWYGTMTALMGYVAGPQDIHLGAVAREIRCECRKSDEEKRTPREELSWWIEEILKVEESEKEALERKKVIIDPILERIKI